jgi:uncharacterized protein YqjF (DUF2071 family)
MVLPLQLGMRNLLFANWPADPAVVADHLPESLSVDTYDGSAWFTAIALRNVDARPRGLPRALGFDLPEVNLHAAVTCEGTPGIYYFSVDVAGLLGTIGPRILHHAPYHYANVRMRTEGDRVRFSCRRRHPGSRPLRFDARYGPSGPELDAPDGSLTRFLAERHRFFSEAPDGSVRSAAIHHEPWPLYPAAATVERNTLFRANGFDDPPADPLCYYSPGVDAVMSRPETWVAPPPADRRPVDGVVG